MAFYVAFNHFTATTYIFMLFACFHQYQAKALNILTKDNPMKKLSGSSKVRSMASRNEPYKFTDEPSRFLHCFPQNTPSKKCHASKNKCDMK